VETESLGGIVPASQVEHIAGEVLGRSRDLPGQEFQLSFPPVLKRKPGEVLEVEQEDGSFLPWQEVEDFGATQPGDTHYTLDNLTGMIRLAPSLRDAAGREIQFGVVPPSGRQLRFTRYRTGGGTKGNVGKEYHYGAQVLHPVCGYRDQWQPSYGRGGRRDAGDGDASRSADAAGALARRHDRRLYPPG
jgi:hypothetical protein